MGDVLLRTPTLEQFKRAYPQAKITAIVEPGRAGLLSNHPDINDCLTMPRPRLKTLTTFLHKLYQLRQQPFDLVMNFYGGGSSLLLTRLIQSKKRLGFATNKCWVKWLRVYTHQASTSNLPPHWGQAFSFILQPLGIKPLDFACRPHFFPTPSTKNLSPNQPFILLNLGAGDTKKMWPLSQFAQLAQWITDQYNLQILIIQNPGQESLSLQLKQQITHQKITHLNRLNFDQLGLLMQHARCLISGDTGPMHLAFAVNCPSLILFTYTPPAYVIPSDCHTEYCFQPNVADSHDGVASGHHYIPLENVQHQFKKLLLRAQKSNCKLTDSK